MLTVALENVEDSAYVVFLVFEAAQGGDITLAQYELLVIDLEDAGIIVVVLIDMELAAQLVIQATRVDFAHQFHHVVLQSIDAGEFHVDTHFHVTFHAVTHMHERLLLEFMGKHGNDTFLHFREYNIRIAVLVKRHGTDDTFEHEDILHFCDIGHQDILLAQVVHFHIAAAVAIHDATALELMETLQVTERAHSLNDLIASAQRLNGLFSENERIESRVNAVLVIALNEQDGLAAAQQVEQSGVQLAA